MKSSKNRTIGLEPGTCAGDLASTHPDLAAQWHPEKNGDLTPRDITRGSHKKVFWRHWHEGTGQWHEWVASVHDRTTDNTGCPYCANKKVLPGFNDLATTHPELAAQWHPTKNGDLSPSDVVAGSGKRVWWRHWHEGAKMWHEWPAPVARRTNGDGCPYCSKSNAKLLPGFNDLATCYPEVAAEWHPTKNGDRLPGDVLAHSGTRVHWLGPCGHEWETRVADRTDEKKGWRGCPYCSGRKVLPGFNDLATRFPEVAAQWHPEKNGDRTPSQVMAVSEEAVWWRHWHDESKQWHEWQAPISQRTHQGDGCPYCSNKRVLEGFNDLASTHPDLAAQWHPTKNGTLLPTDVVFGSGRKVWWRCKCGHEWQAKVVDRAVFGYGCSACSNLGTSRMQEALTLAFEDLLGADNVSARDTERMEFELDILLKTPALDGKEIGIEVGSRYIHGDLSRDLHKTKRCAEEGIVLLGYIDKCGAEERPADLPESWGWHPQDTFREKGQKALHDFFDTVCSLLGIENASSVVDWENINARVNKRFQHLGDDGGEAR